MIYLFTGDDAKAKRTSYEKFLKSIESEAQTFFVNRNNFNKMEIESLYSGYSMFSPLSNIILENVLANEISEDSEEFILEKLTFMGESKNSFIFLEGKLNKPILDAFKKARAEINMFALSKEKKEKFNNFLLADAFGQKDKINLWIYFRQAVDKGVVMEELIGILFWKIKDMILKNPPDRMSSAVRAGDFHKFSKKELIDISKKLSYLLPEARSVGLDAESAFERFLLKVF